MLKSPRNVARRNRARSYAQSQRDIKRWMSGRSAARPAAWIVEATRPARHRHRLGHPTPIGVLG